MTQTTFKEDNIQTLLENIAKNEGFQHPKFAIEDATKPGENFVSRLYRVGVTEEGKPEKSLSLIFKVSSPNKARQAALGSDARFRCESAMYEVIFPTLNVFLRKHGITDTDLFPGTARCLGSELNSDLNNDLSDVIVLEDLKPQGYGIIDIKDGLNANHCRLLLKKLALLHASSMAMLALEPETANQLNGLLGRGHCTGGDSSAGNALLDDLKVGLLTGMGMLNEPYKKGNPLYDRLHKIYENFHMEMEKINETPADLSCIVQGDCWSNNMLFKFNKDGLPEDVCIIDFQTPGKNSPVNDLAVALLMCTSKETRNKHYDELLHFYHDEVTRILQSCGCDPSKIIPWDRFKNHFSIYARLGVLMSLFGLPVIMADKADIKNVDIHSGSSNAPIFSGIATVSNPDALKVLKERLTDVVTDAGRWGYI